MMDAKGRGVPRLLAVQADEPVRRALQIVEQHDITQIPVFRGKELVGTVYDNELLKRVLENSSVLEQKISALMGDPLPVVGADEPLSSVTRLLATRTPAVLVRENGDVTGILTRFDMLQFIAENE
jgi:cystathionine beta-synthase